MSRGSPIVDLVVTRARWVLVVVVATSVIAGIWGLGVVDELSLGGYSDPGSESATVDALVDARFGRDDADIAVIYTPTDGRTLDGIGDTVAEAWPESTREHWPEPPSRTGRFPTPLRPA